MKSEENTRSSTDIALVQGSSHTLGLFMYFRAQGKKERLVNSPIESVIGFHFLNPVPERGASVSFRSDTENEVSFGP